MTPSDRWIPWVALTLAACATPRLADAQWREAPPLVAPRWQHAASAAPDGQVFVFGGRVLVGTQRTNRHATGEFGLDYYDPVAKRWMQGPPVPAFVTRGVKHRARVTGSADLRERKEVPIEEAAVGRREVPYELPFGGADARGRAHWFTSAGPVYFDPQTHVWRQQPGALFHWRSKLALATYEGSAPNWNRSAGATASDAMGRIYLVGGYGARESAGPSRPRGKPAKNGPVAALEIYDSAKDGWREGAPMEFARQVLSAAFGADGRLYVFGGCACTGIISYDPRDPDSKVRAELERRAEDHAVAQTEVYDPKTDSWQQRAPMPTPRMLATASTGKDGRIYVVGGATAWAGAPLDTVEIYDPKTDTWSRGPSLSIGRLAHASAVTPDGTVWAIGGMSDDPGISDVARHLAGERGGPTRSVEILETVPSQP